MIILLSFFIFTVPLFASENSIEPLFQFTPACGHNHKYFAMIERWNNKPYSKELHFISYDVPALSSGTYWSIKGDNCQWTAIVDSQTYAFIKKFTYFSDVDGVSNNILPVNGSPDEYKLSTNDYDFAYSTDYPLYDKGLYPGDAIPPISAPSVNLYPVFASQVGEILMVVMIVLSLMLLIRLLPRFVSFFLP